MLRLCILFVFLSIFSYAQQADRFGRSSNDKIPLRLQMNPIDVKDYIYSKIPTNIKEVEYPRQSYRFAYQSSIHIGNLLVSGQVYSDWDIFETYLNEILNKVIPPELKNEPYIHAYILKRGNFNAFVTPPGMIFVNVGIFNEINNEAELASILAHELAHFYLNHFVETFIKSEDGDFKPGFLLRNKGAYSKYAVQNELDADSLAIAWLANSGYSISAAIANAETFDRLQKKWLSQQNSVFEIEEKTHPNPKRRKKKLLALVESTKSMSANFLINESKFYRFKEEAKKEILKSHLDNLQYNDCIEKAFKYHVYDSTNPIFVYYLMEGIRRYCYFDNGLWVNNFITDRYYEEDHGKSKSNDKIKIDGNYFEYDPSHFFYLDKSKITANFYWESLKFTSYEDAFKFYSQVSEILNEPECILSNALSFHLKTEERDKLLKKYIAHADVLYKDFAIA